MKFTFVLTTLLSRMRRQRARAFFALLAIAASSCLIVWTIGGFQALFLDATSQDAPYLGEYDLRVSRANLETLKSGRGGAFASPLARESYVHNEPSKSEDASVRDGEKEPQKGGRRDGGGRGRRGSESLGIPQEIIDQLRQDESVAVCDEISALLMFVYSPGSARSILEDEDSDPEGDKPGYKRSLELADDEELPASVAHGEIDPELRRKAFGAYRATMGTPLGMGELFFVTTACEPHYELKSGRWLNVALVDGRAPREAVLTAQCAERYDAKVGDDLFLIGRESLIGRTTEYQLKVVGIIDEAETSSFYVSSSLGEELASETALPLAPQALMLKLRGEVASFRARWQERLKTAELVTTTSSEIAERRAEAFKQDQAFKYQAASGTLLASLASLLIIFTALNVSLDDNKRLIALYRVAGLTRGQIALSTLLEAAFLAFPGWCVGMAVGWAITWRVSGKTTVLNYETVGFSFLCTVVGAFLAALYPTLRSARVRPLDAFGERVERESYATRLRRARVRLVVTTVVGFALIAFDFFLIRDVSLDAPRRAALHSGLGVLSLALGVAFLTPLAIRLTEIILAPPLSFCLRLDAQTMRRELSGNSYRVIAVALALSVGGGLFVTMQIWGYSMLDPFLPGRRMPDAFVAFLPGALTPESVAELEKEPFVDPQRFMPVAVEQAAFAKDSVEIPEGKAAFANVVFFGVDVSRAFEGDAPMVGVRFRQGNPKDALQALKNGRGVLLTDSAFVDYRLNVGDVLKVAHPRNPGETLEYPIVGVVSFPGWQWLSKTGGVRRNFGRSGALVFARSSVIERDYQLDAPSYFWFDAPSGVKLDFHATENALDHLALKNLRRASSSSPLGSQVAYAKLSTRDSLTNAIMSRAESVIWGLSKIPITTLIIASIAAVGAVANSVRARRQRYGVMRALGVTRGALTRMILVEASLIGVVAAATSFAFGLLAAQGALMLGRSLFGTENPPLVMPYRSLALGFSLTLALCLAAALYPAFQAGRAEPIALIRNGRSPD